MLEWEERDEGEDDEDEEENESFSTSSSVIEDGNLLSLLFKILSRAIPTFLT